jgi:16S rRNA (uracil1498-N3)-methyltransferase
MHRFYLPPEHCGAKELTLTDSEAHHALRVLRLKVADHVSVLDGAGKEVLCEVANTQRQQVHLVALERRRSMPRPFRVTLMQAVPKGKLFESIIQKATELGVTSVVPLLTERVLIRLGPREAVRRQERWRAVAIEAIKQCGSRWLAEIHEPIELSDFLDRHEKFDLPLIASLQPEARHPRAWFDQFRTRSGQPPTTVGVFIGPEGDFSPNEVEAIEAAGALPITLGSLVLRAETAATYCLSVVNYELTSTQSESRA